MRLLAISLSMLVAALAAADEPSPESRLFSNARQLIYDGKRSGEGYFSPDGSQLLFQSEREDGNPFYQIYRLDLNSGDTTRVSPGTGKTTCASFQPGASRALFASTHHDPQAKAKMQAEIDFRASGKLRRYSWDYDDAMDIFSCEQDGTRLLQLTKERGYDAEAAFSPDGKQIVFCSLRAAYDHALSAEEKLKLEREPSWFGDIYIMNADGSNVRRLTQAPGYDGGPFFSPDGQRIVWRRFDESGMNADVYTMKTDGSDVRRVTDFTSMSWAPFYHPSGKYLIFTSNKLGFENFELFLVDTVGTKEPVRVTYTPGFDGLPVFSPDGTRLCWTTNRGGENKSQLWLANWNHQAALAALDAAPKRGTPIESKPAAAKTPETNSPSPSANTGSPQFKAAISEEDLRAEVDWLAADAREGRQTGMPGAAATAEWLAQYCQAIGLKPIVASDAKGPAAYYQSFDFRAGEKVIADKNSLAVVSGGDSWNFHVEKAFRPLAFSQSGEVEGEVVFAGYGLSVPDGNGQPRYNSYDGLDVKDKVVMLLRYVPEGVDPQRRAHLNRYAGLRYKVMMARERGASGVLVVTGPNSPGAGEVLGLSNDGSNADSGLPAMSISGAVADTLLAASGKSLKDLQTALDTENPHADGGFVVPKATVKFSAAIEHITKSDRNVIAALPGTIDEWIVVGAHYDHLGRGGSSSLAKSGEEGKPHYGADDNASGTAAVMEIAAAFAPPVSEGTAGSRPIQNQKDAVITPSIITTPIFSTKPRRGIIFAFWSGEEIGLLGSASFCEHPPVPLEKIAAYVNFDMVGRLRDNKLSMQGIGSSKLWRKLLEKRNVAAGFNLVMQDDPYLPTDVTSFYPKRIPVLNFFTGAHEDYHRPSDTADKIDYAGLERITKFADQIVRDISVAPERPDYARVERSDQGGGSRETLRAYLGTIPDYTQEVKGVKLSGVRGGSPAEKGGLKGGDIIVEFAGQKITNIYDYTYGLDAVKIGQPVKIVVERDSKRMEITVTPEARK